MRLRVALKIYHNIDTPRESRYTPIQLTKACDRYARLRSSKLNKECFHLIMKGLGPEGRAEMAKRRGDVAEAFSILMRYDPEEWAGDPEAWEQISKLQD